MNRHVHPLFAEVLNGIAAQPGLLGRAEAKQAARRLLAEPERITAMGEFNDQPSCSEPILYIAGRHEKPGPWEVLGVFDEPHLAAEACTRSNDFIAEVALNKRLPEGRVPHELSWYPPANLDRSTWSREDADDFAVDLKREEKL